MKNWKTLSNNDLNSQSPHQVISPHPPSEPNQSKNDALVKIRQRRYRHQSSEHRIDDRNLDVREIRSADSSSFIKVDSLQSGNSSIKTKISSAPSPRTRTLDYRTSNFKREQSAGLYTFDSIPSLIQDSNDVQTLPRMKRKEQSGTSKSIPSVVLPTEPDLAPITISKNIIPCISQASPVTSDNHRSIYLVKRQSLQQMSRDRVSQLSRRSIQRSDFQTNSDFNSSIPCLSSLEYYGNEPIDLKQYRSPNDASDSFEAKMLASLAAESAKAENANNTSATFPKLLSSKNFSTKVTPRTEALIGGSYSDDESSATTTGPLTNRFGPIANHLLSTADQNGMHNEWKRHFNQSQDTCRSIDILSTITDWGCQSATVDSDAANSGTDVNVMGTAGDGYILVHYISELDCYIDPKTGVWYESNL